MRFKFFLGILISAVFLYFFIQKINWVEVWQIIKSIHYIYLLLAMGLHMIVYLLRAKRWQDLLVPLKKIPLFSVFSATIICFMGNNIFPARLGEIIRAYVLGRRENISKSAIMATIVVERLFDGFTVIVFLIWLLWFFPFPKGAEQNEIVNPSNLKYFGILSGGIYFAVIVFLLIAQKYYQSLLRWLGKFMQPRFSSAYEKVVDLTESFVTGLESLKRGKHLYSIIISSLLIWLMVPVVFYSLYPAFELQLPFSSAVLLTVVIALAVAVPSSPGYVGTFHFACATSLILLGVEPNKAKSFALILHGLVFVPVTVLGLIFVYMEKLNLKELQALENEA